MTQRTDRVGEAIREVLAEEIAKLTDPRLGLVSITGVDVSTDLAHGVVYFSLLGDESARNVCEVVLGGARVRLQAAVARNLHIKRTPRLRFAPDPGVLQGERIDALLRDLHIEHDDEG